MVCAKVSKGLVERDEYLSAWKGISTKTVGRIHAIWTFGFSARQYQWLNMQEVLL